MCTSFCEQIHRCSFSFVWVPSLSSGEMDLICSALTLFTRCIYRRIFSVSICPSFDECHCEKFFICIGITITTYLSNELWNFLATHWMSAKGENCFLQYIDEIVSISTQYFSPNKWRNLLSTQTTSNQYANCQTLVAIRGFDYNQQQCEKRKKKQLKRWFEQDSL